MVMNADTGNKTAASIGSDVGLVTIRFVRNDVDTSEKKTLKQPHTNISLEVEISSLLHFEATTLATDAAIAA